MPMQIGGGTHHTLQAGDVSNSRSSVRFSYTEARSRTIKKSCKGRFRSEMDAITSPTLLPTSNVSIFISPQGVRTASMITT